MSEEQQSAQTVAATIDSARNEALAAFENAEKADGTVKSETPKPADAPKADEAKTEEPKPEAAENKIAVLMRARKQAQRVRESAETEAQAKLREIQAKEAELLQREKSVVSKLRERPIEALRELGLDPREFFERAVEDPKKLEPVSQLKAELDEMRAQYGKLEELLKRRDEEAAQHARTSAQEQAKRVFVGQVFAANGKYPYLNALYGDAPEHVANSAVSVIREYVNRGGDPTELTNDEIAEWLESQERERYNSVKSRLERVGSEATEPAGGNVSLTQKDASVKKSQRKKAVSEMSAQEARDAALAALEGAA